MSPATIRGVLPILDADWLARTALFSEKQARHGRSNGSQMRHGRSDGSVMPRGIAKSDGRILSDAPAPSDDYAPSDDHATPKDIARFLGGSTISSVQLRCKGTGREAFLFASLWMQALRTHSPHITVMINDHVALALALKADGVHVGQDDMPVALCRQLLGPDKIIGLSTHSAEEVVAANRSDADYIGFGPVFATHSKPDAQPAQGLASLADVCRLSQKPVVAIGGIHLSQMEAVAASGASAIAMISGVWDKRMWPQRLAQASRF